MYSQQLAFIHDRWFGSLSRSAADHLRSLLPSGVDSILDLGCGSGILLQEFYRESTRGYGSDVSKAFIEICQERLPRFSFQLADLFDTEIPKVATITMIGEILSYAGASSNNYISDIKRLFRNVAASLSQTGVFLFDFLDKTHDFNYEAFHEAENYAVFMKSSHSDSLVSRQITSYLRTGDAFHRAGETHYLRPYSVDELQVLLHSEGFETVLLSSYAETPLPPGRVAFQCKRKNGA